MLESYSRDEKQRDLI